MCKATSIVRRPVFTILFSAVLLILVGCALRTIGGSVQGLEGSGLVLQNNGGDDVTITTNGTFAFATGVLDTKPYSITVLNQPTAPAQTCTVTNGDGIVLGKPVADVLVSCVTDQTYAIGGTVKFMNGSGLVLQSGAGENLPILANGDFSFTEKVSAGSAYTITVLNQPSIPAQTCVVTNGSGTVSSTDVIDIVVTCSAWTKQLGTTLNDTGRGVAIDATGNMYVTATTSGAFEGQTSMGGVDVVLVRYDVNGNHVWTRQFGSAADDNVFGVETDPSGNVYVTGGTSGSLDGSPHNGVTDIYLIKYDVDGNRLWTRQIGTSAPDNAYQVVTDATGNIYIGGDTAGNLDGNLSSGSLDMFVIKFDTDGNRLWTRQFGGSGQDSAWDIARDHSGNVYLSGTTMNSHDGQPVNGFSDALLVKYDTDGNRLWARVFGTTEFDSGNGVITDMSGNVYVSGITSGSVDNYANAGGQDMFVTKFDAQGVRIWTHQLGTPAFDQAFDIAVDSTSAVYVAGNTEGHIDGNVLLGSRDIFVTKYDADGNKLWTRQFGSSAFDELQDITTDTDNNAYIAGRTNGALDGHVNAGTGTRDVIIVKYDSDGVKQ